MDDDFALEPKDIFALACYAVARDGVLDRDEEALLERLREGLGIPWRDARSIRDKAFATPRALDAEPVPFDRLDLFAQVCRLAWFDQVLSEEERGLLLHLARLLGIPVPEAVTRLEAARALMARTR